MTGSTTSEFRHFEISINGDDSVVPLALDDEYAVIAVACSAGLIGDQGGFRAVLDPPEMIAQVQLIDVPDEWQAVEDVLASSEWLLQTVDICQPELVRRGGGARAVRARTLAPGRVAVDIVVDCCGSTSANLVNEIAAYLAPTLADLTGARLAMRILTNVADTRLVRVHARVRPEQLDYNGYDGDELVETIAALCEFADFDAGRATTLNRAVLETVNGVIIASGHDWRAVQAGAHAYAARTGGYRPLVRWAIDDDGSLVGELTMPVSLGAVAAEIAQELAAAAGSIGLAASLASLYALAQSTTEPRSQRRSTTERPVALGNRRSRAKSNKGLPAPRQDTTRPFIRAS